MKKLLLSVWERLLRFRAYAQDDHDEVVAIMPMLLLFFFGLCVWATLFNFFVLAFLLYMVVFLLVGLLSFIIL